MSKDLADDERVRAEVDKAILTPKGNYSPIMVRLAWHSSGTYDKDDKSSRHGGSDGATMRFDPESSDPANAGLTIPQEVLKPIKDRFPTLSYGKLSSAPRHAFLYRVDDLIEVSCISFSIQYKSGFVDFSRRTSNKDYGRT
jgi:hypothetical protein